MMLFLGHFLLLLCRRSLWESWHGHPADARIGFVGCVEWWRFWGTSGWFMCSTHGCSILEAVANRANSAWSTLFRLFFLRRLLVVSSPLSTDAAATCSAGQLDTPLLATIPALPTSALLAGDGRRSRRLCICRSTQASSSSLLFPLLCWRLTALVGECAARSTDRGSWCSRLGLEATWRWCFRTGETACIRPEAVRDLWSW